MYQESYLNGHTIEIHYWLNNQSHSMDAFVQNKCELELLNIINEIAKKFNSNVVVETEPFGEGGLRRWFNISSFVENNKAIIKTAFVTAFITGVMVTPINTVTSEVMKKFIDRFFEDKELQTLLKERTKEEIQNLRIDTELKTQQLIENKKIYRKRSNFYLALKEYPKTDKITFSIEDRNKKPIHEEMNVYKKDFDDYILFSDELDPEIDKNAVIEIVSPILNKKNFKWKGIYNGVPLSFNMKSSEFKTLVQTGKIQFKNGSKINCVLAIYKKLNSDGEEVITGYDVLSVDENVGDE